MRFQTDFVECSSTTLHCFRSHASNSRPKYFCYFFNHTNLGLSFRRGACQLVACLAHRGATYWLIDCTCASPGVKLFQLLVPKQVLKISAAKSVCTLKRECFIWKLNCTKTYSTQTVGHCSNTERNFLFIFQASNLDCNETSLSCETISLFKTKTKITWWVRTIP